MYSNVGIGQVAPDTAEEAIRQWHDSLIPAAQGKKGFHSARLLLDRKSGEFIHISLWESEADANASAAAAGSDGLDEQRAKFLDLMIVPLKVVHCELVSEV